MGVGNLRRREIRRTILPRWVRSTIENRTSPPVHVTARLIEQSGVKVVAIEVPESRLIVATSGGRTLRRRSNHLGEPECLPMLPHELAARLAHFGSSDYPAPTVPGAGAEGIDPIERARIRRTIETRLLADKTLLKLTEDELDGALKLIAMNDGKRCSTVDRRRTLRP